MRKVLGVLVVAVSMLGAACGGSSSSDGGSTPTSKPSLPGVVEYKVVDTNMYNSGWQVVAGPGGSVWFTADTLGIVGSVGPTGRVAQFVLPPPANPSGIAVGPDGNLWYTDILGKVGRVTHEGTVTAFDVPGVGRGIASGPDGALWFGASGGLGRISTAGVVEHIPVIAALPDGSTLSLSSEDLAFATDGSLWFTSRALVTAEGQVTGVIGRRTPQGEFRTFLIAGASGSLERIAAGPDGNVWFTDGVSRATQPAGGNRIGRITPGGTITMFPVPTANSAPGAITAGPDGNLWFVQRFASQIARITPTGVVTEYAIPGNVNPLGITAGPNGTIWYSTVKFQANVGRFVP